jgi:hypothetical protein
MRESTVLFPPRASFNSQVRGEDRNGTWWFGGSLVTFRPFAFAVATYCLCSRIARSRLAEAMVTNPKVVMDWFSAEHSSRVCLKG